AVAPDGVVEAFSVADASGFNLCLQWHPEWQAADNPVSMQLLGAFGQAVRAWRDQHKTSVRNPVP
ncbi:MAG: gamma-glutamyl-gamma-aminobutyrate hydrolase family protein, partial [Aquabacterium sp.]|nr:gamma-glutamyl-gamma-aminobutyrate hydrolase family protein [Aquabacterium sp.]